MTYNKKESPLSANVHFEPNAVVTRLSQLGLEADPLRIAVSRGQLAVDNCTANHPRMFPPLAGWAETVRGLREYLVTKEWTNSDDQNYSRALDPTGKLAIAVATGNEETGLVSGQPTTKASKGPSTLEAVLVNVQQLNLFTNADFSGLASPAHAEQEDKRATWILLIHRAAGETRSELSLPVVITEGRITEWRERIILGTISRDPQPLRVDIPELPDLDIQVKRRA